MSQQVVRWTTARRSPVAALRRVAAARLGAQAGLRRAVVTALVLGLLALAGASPAAAHDQLVGSDPADGSVLTTAPTQVVLTFSAEPLAAGRAAALVTGADGSSWWDGDAVIAGTTVTQQLRPGMPAGEYTVTWQAPSSDGHVLTGTLAFTLAPPPAAEPSASPSSAPEATEPAGAPGPAASATAAPAPGTPSAAPSDRSDDDRLDAATNPVRWLVAGLVVVAVGGVVLALALRRPGAGA